MRPKLNVDSVRHHLENFEFQQIFVQHLNWGYPRETGPRRITVRGRTYEYAPVADLEGVLIAHVTANGEAGDQKIRQAVYRSIRERHADCVVIFTDESRTSSRWLWAKKEGKRLEYREHTYFKGQPGDLFISKLAGLFFDISQFDEKGRAKVGAVYQVMKDALDIERVTKKFFDEFRTIRIDLARSIKGLPGEKEQTLYASVLLNRLMFIYFLQKKLFLAGQDERYLEHKLDESKANGKDRYFGEFLKTLFFDVFLKPEGERTEAAKRLCGAIPYLNGGLFLRHELETNYPISIPDSAFENLLRLFAKYTWTLNDVPYGKDNEINPEILGYILEKYINDKSYGAYYTRKEITEYLCEQTIHQLILDKVKELTKHSYTSVDEMLFEEDDAIHAALLREVLPTIKVLDPACGSGAFLVAAMKTIVRVYHACAGRAYVKNDPLLSEWLKENLESHRDRDYHIKKLVITNNLFGVDLMDEAAEISKLRLFMALLEKAKSPEDLEPLPNIDFNIRSGNSLIGLMRVEDEAYDSVRVKGGQGSLYEERHKYKELVAEKNNLTHRYAKGDSKSEDLQKLREDIESLEREARAVLHSMFLEKFHSLRIRFEQATWDAKQNDEGKPVKRDLTIQDIQELKPFHWGFEFSKVMGGGGFDAIITNPPWEILKPQAKEFFQEHSDLVSKNKMTIKEFEALLKVEMKKPGVRDRYLEYLSRFPHQSAYFRAAEQFKYQSAIVNGKKTGTDINLYKLFTEQCFNLLRDDGLCGIVIPSGIYTDLGAKGLREMLFEKTCVTGLFGFENRKKIFDEVDSRFKFVVLTFRKGGTTEKFPACFMRHDVQELERFPKDMGLPISVELIKRLSPDSWSVMEFKSDMDVRIAEKMLKFPLLGERIDGTWNLKLTREFDMTNDSRLFHTSPGPGRLPLYEGKMIWQFDHKLLPPRFWVDEPAGRRAILGKQRDEGQQLGYQHYRLGFRDIAANTNERTLVSTIIPPAFHGNKLPTAEPDEICAAEQVYLCALWNSYILDYTIRQKVTTTLNFFYMYQLPAPRIAKPAREFAIICTLAARLICTCPEFDSLAKEAGLRDHRDGVTDPEGRAKIRAELDARIAHLYGLTEEEFTHILSTFPLVKQDIKDATLAQFRFLASVPSPPSEIESILARGEAGNDRTEFKSSLEADIQTGQKFASLVDSCLKTICAFLNTNGGDLLIGVDDAGNPLGLQKDYALITKKQNKDGFEGKLSSLLQTRFSDPKPGSRVSIKFPVVNGVEICHIHVEAIPKSEIAHFDNAVYERQGGLSRKLEGPDLAAWIARRLGGSKSDVQ